jgi:hypothetical protein
MSEFMKNKVNFALALLGTLFVLLQFEDRIQPVTQYTDFTWDDLSVSGYDISLPPFKLVYAFGVAGALLALSVYFYAMAIMTHKSSSKLEWLGNQSYALAILVLPVYALLVLSHWASVQFGYAHLHYAGPAALGVIVVLWLGFSFILRGRLGRQDRRSEMRQLSHHEVEHVRRARDMHAHHHYDMAIIESWKALEARLQRLLLHRGYTRHMTMPQMIDAARRENIITPELGKHVQDLRNQWNIAVSTTPLTKDAAESALQASRKLMSALPVEDHDPREVAQKKV